MGTLFSTWLTSFSGKRLLLAAFRVSALIPAIIPLAVLGDDLHYSPSPVILIVVSSLYTGFKLAHPLEWHRSKLSNMVLFGTDLGVVLCLVTLSGGIHSPFMLYAFAPVLTTGLLLPRRATAIVSGVSGVYIILLALYAPRLSRVETAEHLSLVSIYVMALGIFAILPYTINTVSKRQLKSAAMLDERRRLGREIHDGLCQTVYGLRWELQMLGSEAHCTEYVAEKLTHLRGLVDEAEKDIRGSMESLRAIKGDRPLLSQIQGYLSFLENDVGMACRLEADREPDLDELIKIEVLDICLEALRNVAKHSKAHAVTVSMFPRNGRLQVQISDDGHGFNRIPMSGHGLMVMKERAESIGGWLRVTSAPGTGTRILLEVPRLRPLEQPEV